MEKKNFAAEYLRKTLKQSKSENFLLKSALEKTKHELEKTKRELEHAHDTISGIRDFITSK